MEEIMIILAKKMGKDLLIDSAIEKLQKVKEGKEGAKIPTFELTLLLIKAETEESSVQETVDKFNELKASYELGKKLRNPEKN